MSAGGMLDRMSTSRSAYGLALWLAAAGGSHFAAPRVYDAIVPRMLPGGPRMWTYLSGAAELAVAAAVACPRTRRGCAGCCRPVHGRLPGEREDGLGLAPTSAGVPGRGVGPSPVEGSADLVGAARRRSGQHTGHLRGPAAGLGAVVLDEGDGHRPLPLPARVVAARSKPRAGSYR